MKIKYTGTEPNMDISLSLVDDLKSNGIVLDQSQVIGIYDEYVELEGVLPSEALTSLLTDNYPLWRINPDPSETSAFAPEPGLPDVDKIGTVNDPIYQTNDNLESIELFPESEITTFSEKSGESTNINKKVMSKKVVRKNFDDPAVNQEGISVEGTQVEVVADQEKKDADFQPEAGSFESTDVAPFTDEEIDAANNVEVESDNGEITVFTEEEIENMTDPEEVERTAEEMEREQEAFSNRQKRLFAAKRRLRKVNSKRADRKTFAEELSDAEESSIIEDIVAILQDAPEIMTAVAEEVDGMEIVDEETPAEETTEVIETAAETPEEEVVVEAPAVETPVEETVVETPSEEVVTEETPAEPTEEVTVEEPVEEEIDIDAFTEAQIEEAPEVVEDISETVAEETTAPEEEGHTNYNEETPGETPEEEVEVVEETEAGRVFNKAFCNDGVKGFRRQMLAEMASKQTSIRNRK